MQTMLSKTTRTTLIITIFSVVGLTAGVSQTAFAQNGSTDSDAAAILECIEGNVDADSDAAAILECINTDSDAAAILECIEGNVEG